MKSLNRTAQLGTFANLSFWIWGFLIGIWILWLYAVIRPHYGPGPKTAAIAGSAVWVPGSLLAWIAPAALGLFEYRLILIGVVAGLVEFVAGAVAGAWLYQDQEASEANKAGSGR